MSGAYSQNTVVMLIAAGFALAAAILAWRGRATPGSRSFIWLMLAVAEWGVARALEAEAVGMAAKVFWAKAEYLAVVSVAPLCLIFTLEHIQLDGWLTCRNRVLLWIVPLLTLGLAWTNERHHWLWSEIVPVSGDPAADLIYHRGFWFWLHTFFGYLLVLASAALLAQAIARFPHIHRRQSIMFLAGLMIAWAGNAFYVARSSAYPVVDLRPLAAALAAVMATWLVLRLRLFDLVPVARHALVENMRDGILVLDAQNRIVDINPAAQHLFGPFAVSPLGQPASAVLAAWPGLADRCLAAPEAESEFFLDGDPVSGKNPIHLDMRASSLRDRVRRVRGRLIVFHDITHRKQAEAALRQLNADLEQTVSQRTAELRASIYNLESQNAERAQVEAALRQAKEDLARRVAEQGHKLAALYEINVGDLLSTPQEVLERILSRIVAATGGDAACIHQQNGTDFFLQLTAHQGLTAEAQSRARQFPVGLMPEDAAPRAVMDLQADANAPASLRLPGFASYLGAPMHLRGELVGVLSIFWRRAAHLQPEDIAAFGVMAEQLGVIIENAGLRQRIEDAGVLKERRRLARDLHDSVTQSLHSLALTADTARNRLRRGHADRLEESLDQLAWSARQALREMRLLLYELRLVPLIDVNLLEALDTRLEAVERRAGVDAQLIVEGTAQWPKAWEVEMYRLATEALNNALKHAQATRVTVRLEGGNNRAQLEVADNGRGFDPQQPHPGGYGLRTMTERAEQLGGRLTIESSGGAGTRVVLRVEADDSPA